MAGHILNNMSSGYATVVTSIVASGQKKDVEAIKESVELYYKKHGKNEDKDEGGRGNSIEAFVMEHFKGKYNYCGKPGHKAADCFKRKAKERKGFRGGSYRNNFNQNKNKKLTCWICGGKHMKKDCSTYRKNQGGDKGNELNHIYEGGLFVCEYVNVRKPSYKDVIVLGEMNMSVPTHMEEEEVKIEDIEEMNEDSSDDEASFASI